MEPKELRDIQTIEWKKDLNEICSLVAGYQAKHFWVVKDGKGKVYIKTKRTYKQNNDNERHPLEKKLRIITRYYYREGKAKTIWAISKGEFQY